MRATTNFRRLLLLSAFALAACSQGSDIASPGASDSGTPPGGGGGGGGGGGLVTTPLAGSITSNTTLRTGVIYELEGRVNIGADVGPVSAGGPGQLSPQAGTPVTLTIEPGAVIIGESGADHIVINRGSRIVAEGTPDRPIIFTSKQDLERQADANPSNDDGDDAIGEWGGLVILGRAPINRCRTAGAVPGSANCDNIVEGVTNPEALYGGTNPNDDSGILKYVQVRFAGFPLPGTSGNELNGITFGGVGRNTVVDFVQVHNNADDGVEFFGGAVNVKHLVLTGNDDESLDTDNGYQGKLQFVLAVQRASGGDNVVEASSVAGATPLSNATVANFTFIGGGQTARGWRLNTGTVGHYINGVIDHPRTCFEWASTAGDGAAGFSAATDPNFTSVLFDCAGGVFGTGDSAAVTGATTEAGANNVIGASSLSGFFPGPNEAAVTPFNASSIDPTFFTQTAYVGAFAPNESETNNWAAGWTFALFPPPACPTGTTDVGAPIGGKKVCSVSGIVTNDLRLVRGNHYRLDGRVDIGRDVGPDGLKAGGDVASITIESGVTVFGNEGADHLVINRGSQIFSNGTATSPVIFTSENDLNGTLTDANAIGQWGGIVILGQARNNRCRTVGATPGTNACDNIVEGVTNPEALYGGEDDNDDSGSIRYTQVRYAGFPLPGTSGNELNGITFASVGRNTDVDFVQVHNNADDGVEFFGGNVNAKHLVLTGNDDESLDTDNGYNGKLQFVLVVQRTAGGDNVVEASSVAGATPLSNATVANFTFVGGGQTARGWRLNTGTVGHYVNGVIDHPRTCFEWASTAGDGVAGFSAAADPNFTSVLFDCAGGVFGTGDSAAVTAATTEAGANNVIGASSLAAPFLSGAAFINGTAETGVTGFDVTTLDAFFSPAPYAGAVRNASDTWWSGWSCGLASGSSC